MFNNKIRIRLDIECSNPNRIQEVISTALECVLEHGFRGSSGGQSDCGDDPRDPDFWYEYHIDAFES